MSHLILTLIINKTPTDLNSGTRGQKPGPQDINELTPRPAASH